MPQDLVIDSISFALRKSRLDGKIGLLDLARLASELVSLEGDLIHYSLRGDCGSENEPMLFLELHGTLVLQCQRCLQPMVIHMDVDTAFELRDGLADDALLQDDLEDDSRDYLPASRTLDLVSLIEDEALLALPLVPKHAACGSIDLRHDTEAASPFGVLLGFKGRSGLTH